MKNKYTLLFIVIIFIASFFRLYKLSEVPPNPSLDEVTTGYNAYSILKTGADEFGYKMPILLRAYDDWRPAMYMYITIPFIFSIGLNVLAVRLPSALMSIGAVIAFYFLAKKLLRENDVGKANYFALIPTLFLAISPWHIYISRLGHEVNAATTFFIVGFAFFLNAFKKGKLNNNYLLIASSVFFALSFDSYQSTKIFIPIFVLLLLTINFKNLINSWKKLLLPCVVGLVIIAPVLFQSVKPDSLIRFKATSVFSIPFETKYANSQKLIDFKKNRDYLDVFFYNRNVFPIYSFTRSFLSHFSYNWLFVNHNNEQFKMPGVGLLNIIELPTLLLGLLYLVFMRKWRLGVFLLLWFLIGILPSALTTDAPHPMRAFEAIGVFPLLSGLGFMYIYDKIKTRNLTAGLIVVCIVIITLTVFRLHNSYFLNFSKNDSNQFEYGILQAFDYVEKTVPKNQQVIVSTRDYLVASYMYYLFFNKYDPDAYQKNGGSISGWLDYTHRIDNFTFTNPRTIKSNGIYMIINPNEFLGGRVVQSIHDLNGREVIQIVQR